MMLPPALEVYVVWHPADAEGARIAERLLDHFNGTRDVGLIGGSVEVYRRSASWGRASEAPRPLPFQSPLPHGLLLPKVVAVVPILGIRLARAVESESSPWRRYLSDVRAAAESSTTESSTKIGIFPVHLPGELGGDLLSLLGELQSLPASSVDDKGVLCREISQQVVQMAGSPQEQHLTVFISHTKRHSPDEEPDDVNALVERVRSRIAKTHLAQYIDVSSLQPGSKWKDELQKNAASNCLLAVRTDLYATRQWCQTEFYAAKQAGMPIVTLHAVQRSKQRGSFLMDHVPVVGCRDGITEATDRSIDEALNLLVDVALRRVLWQLMKGYWEDIGVDWAPHEAPEPVTAISWLHSSGSPAEPDRPIVVMHPDPPLGPAETKVMKQLFALAGLGDRVSVVTPRTFASRSGAGA